MLPPILPLDVRLGSLLISKEPGGRPMNMMSDFRVLMNNWKRTHLRRKQLLPPLLLLTMGIRDGITQQRHQDPTTGLPMAHTSMTIIILPPSNLF